MNYNGMYDNLAADYDDERALADFDDESYDDDSYDDDSYDDDSLDDESAEFLPLLAAAAPLAAPLIGRGINAAIGGVRNLLGGGRGRPHGGGRPRPDPRGGGPVTTANLNNPTGGSNVTGQLVTPSGNQVAFQLPPNVATLDHINELRRGIQANAKGIRELTRSVKANAGSIGNVSRQLTSIDQKHTTASQGQNQILSAINKRMVIMGKRQQALRREQESMKQQAQMQAMMSMLIQPELSSITVTNPAAFVAGANTLPVTASQFDNNNLLPLLMMSGGFGGSGGNNNGMMMALALSGGL